MIQVASKSMEKSVEDLKEVIIKGDIWWYRDSSYALRDDFKLRHFSNTDFEGSERIGLSVGGRANLVWLKMRNGELLAVKSFTRQHESQAKTDPHRREKFLQYFKRECGLWKLAESAKRVDTDDIHIVKIMGFTEGFDKKILPSLVIELYQLGDLRSFVNNNRNFPEEGRLYLLYDIATGLAYMHDAELMIVHRDIKAANILVRQGKTRLEAAIADFGSAKSFDNLTFPVINSTPSLSISWTPPEYITNQGAIVYSNPSIFGDVWSFGCTFIETFTGSDPWGEDNTLTEPFEHLSRMKSPAHPPRPECFLEKPQYWNLLLNCFHDVPHLRPSGRILRAALDGFIKEC